MWALQFVITCFRCLNDLSCLSGISNESLHTKITDVGPEVSLIIEKSSSVQNILQQWYDTDTRHQIVKVEYIVSLLIWNTVIVPFYHQTSS